MTSELDYSIYYRQYHSRSDDHIARMIALHANQLGPHLPSDRDSSILDIGCGMGFALLGLKHLGYANLQGIDSDEHQIEGCLELQVPATHVRDSELFLRDHRDSFDVVLMLDVLEHVPVCRQLAILRALFAALREGGRAILTVPNATSILAARWRYNDFTHSSSFTEKSLEFVLRNAGFDDVRIAGDNMPRPSVRLWRKDARQGLRKWIVRYLWKQVLAAEIGSIENVNELSTDLNLFAVAHKLTSLQGA